jgi:hypothetical protein
MITPAGSVIEVSMQTGGTQTAQVSSAGPPSVPASVWAVTTTGPRRFILVKRQADPAATPRYVEVNH